MYKQCEVVMLATNKKTKLQLTKNYLNLAIDEFVPDNRFTIGQHLYIISDEEIKEGDWVIIKNDTIFQNLHGQMGSVIGNDDYLKNNCKKIIATTDKSFALIQWGEEPKPFDVILPQIPQSFIELFVSEYNKGNIITKVMVEYSDGQCHKTICDDHCSYPNCFEKNEPTINPDNTINIKTVKDSLYHGNTLEYWRNNANENYLTTPISVLKYITVLEEIVKDSFSRDEVIGLITKAISDTNQSNNRNVSTLPDKWLEQNL